MSLLPFERRNWVLRSQTLVVSGRRPLRVHIFFAIICIECVRVVANDLSKDSKFLKEMQYLNTNSIFNRIDLR